MNTVFYGKRNEKIIKRMNFDPTVKTETEKIKLKRKSKIR